MASAAREVSVGVRRRSIERQLDDALLAVSAATGALYVRRKLRRLISKLTLLGALLAGAGVLGGSAVVGAWLRGRGRGT